MTSPPDPSAAPPLPTAARPSLAELFRLDRSRKLSLALGLVAAAVAVTAAASYLRPEPAPVPGAEGLRVERGELELAQGAAQWSTLRLGRALTPAERLGDAHPARFMVDETQASKVGSPLAGRVTAVFVELGQAVKAGDPLFTVSSPDIAELRAAREKARVEVQLARASLERVQAMVAARALPAKDELTADAELRQARLALSLAESKLRSLKVSSKSDSEFLVVAPREGTIIEKNVLLAQEVTPDVTLVGVADVRQVWVVAELYETDAAGVQSGTPAEISSPTLPGFSAEGRVDMVSAVVDPVRHTVGVRIRLPNEAGKIRPNAYAEVRFRTSVPSGAVEVATSALVSDGAEQYVYVQQRPGHFARRRVVASSSRGGRVLVLEGLEPGAEVVEQGATLLDNQIDLES